VQPFGAGGRRGLEWSTDVITLNTEGESRHGHAPLTPCKWSPDPIDSLATHATGYEAVPLFIPLIPRPCLHDRFVCELSLGVGE
jgi:hypothetical protein